MQVTNEVLHKYATNTVEKLTKMDHTIIAVLLTGSMVTEESAFLGGTADIDLIFIHVGDPKIDREILRLSDDIHLDISHQPQRDFLRRIELRVDPWKGPLLQEAVTLYDPQHFMDLTQASVRGLFYRAENVIQRSRTAMEAARNIWMELQLAPEIPGPPEVAKYLQAINYAANALALLVGEPLTERRFLINFPKRAERLERPGLAAGLLGMLGAPNADLKALKTWLIEWEQTLQALPSDARKPGLSAYRFNYYRKAFDVLLESGQPEQILWPLLRTWTDAALSLPPGDPALTNWLAACQQLGILSNNFDERISALNAFFEQIEETIRSWATEEGVF